MQLLQRVIVVFELWILFCEVKTTHVTDLVCSFEEDPAADTLQLCGWGNEVSDNEGAAGIKAANNATDPFPPLDTLPGSINGSYFFYQRPESYSSDVVVLNYPRQQYITSISFDYYITGVTLLQLVKISVSSTDIISSLSWAENITEKWTHASVTFDQHNFDAEYGFSIISPGLEAELGEAADELSSTLSLDNLTIEFTLPCNFDELAEIGKLKLSPPDTLIIPLGEVTVTQFTASSSVCPNGPFVYSIESNDTPELKDIFSINSTTGAVTINATGPGLVTEGVTIGNLIVSVSVKDSDYLGTGEVVERHSTLIYQQKPTIDTESCPTSINVQAQKNFTYDILATSQVNSVLKYSNLHTNPSSLSESIVLQGSVVSGQITQSGLLDIIEIGQIPTFAVDISDTYGGTILLTVELLLPETPPTFNKIQYTFEVDESVKLATMGNFTVGDINEDDCDAINVTLVATEFNPYHYFHILNTQDVYDTESLCLFFFFIVIPLDYEEKTSYELNITATDSKGHSTVAMTTVSVKSVNEYSPQFFNGGNQKILTNYMSSIGKLIYELEATDKDSGPAGQLHYDITKGNEERNFRLSQTSNELVQIQSDSQGLKPGTYNLTVVVSDGQSPVKTDTAHVVVVVVEGDINCTSNDAFDPPTISISAGVKAAVDGDATIYCNYTSFPPAYPIQWSIFDLDDFTSSPISPNSHYTFQENKLIIRNLTSDDNQVLYRCSVSNPCGSVYSSYILLTVIELPVAVDELRIKDGPYVDYIVLTWTPPPRSDSRPIDGYKVRLKKGGGDYMDYQELKYHESNEVDPVSETSLISLQPGTNYSVVIVTHNIAGESGSDEITFTTNVSAPLLAMFDAISLDNHSLLIEWVLAYSGGSGDIHMSIDVRSHTVRRRKRSSESSVAITFEVEVEDQSLVTPSLPFGQSYEVTGTLVNKHGVTTHTVTAFVGFQDISKCSFTTTSSCEWERGETSSLQSGDSSQNAQPQQDATGDASGAYIVSLPMAPDSTWNILSYHSLSYLCGYSFYYQLYDSVRLVLVSASSLWNETVYWVSSEEDVREWTLEEVPAGDIPITTTPQELIFMMDTFQNVFSGSFVAIDEVSLYFCLPCDFGLLTNESFVTSSPTNTTLYLRSYQKLAIKTQIKNCSNPILSYSVKEVVPNHLKSKISVPNQREGAVVIDDVTPDMAAIGTEGTVQVTVELTNANYKHNGLILSKTITIPFVVSEKFVNCSDVKSCLFDDGLCDWTAGDQSNLATDNTGNKFVIAKPSSKQQQTFEIMKTVINDSYCGINFLYKTHAAEIQVSVDGLGLLWSTAVEEERAGPVQGNLSLSWQEVSLYIDVMGVDMKRGRKVVMEGVASGGGEDDGVGAMVSIDNVTLHPCVDCQAKECSCISCIQQCSTEPCQAGYYLSLEVNQCRPCPKGHYCSSWRSLPVPCPPGTFYNTTGAQTKDSCHACPQGTYSIKTAATDSCTDCPPGHYCADASSLPVECPVGTYYNATRAWKSGMCQECPDNTYSLVTGARYCEDCPVGYDCVEGGELPVPNTSAQTYLAGVIGAVAGAVLLILVVTVLVVYCYCRSRAKRSAKRKRDKAVYKENFLVGLDSNSSYVASGPKTGTVRTASTILSLKNERVDPPSRMIQNDGFYDSNESSDDETTEERQSTLLPLGKFTKEGTVSSLKSLGSTRDWTDINPFSTSESHSDMSVLIELDDERDHVWSALKQKKKSESKF